MTGSKAEVIKWLCDAPDAKYEVKEAREKRSLTANSYYHALLDQLKGVLKTSRDELHQQLLERYSEAYLTENGNLMVVGIRKDIPQSALPGHWRFYRNEGNASYYFRILGSSDMDSKQFSHLLDGLISECQEVGIPTLTENELKKLKGYTV